MHGKQLTLYVGSDFVSVFAMSAFVALTEKGLDFDLAKVNLKKKEQHRPEYQNISLTSKVPTLVVDTFRLSESSAISEYLDEAFPEPDYPRLFPRDVADRARARQVQAWLRSDLMPIRSERPADLFYFEGAAKPLSEDARFAVNKLFRVAGSLLKNGSENLFGEWCIADMDLAVMLYRLVFNGDEVPAKLETYVRRQWERPSVQKWVRQDRSDI